MEVKILPLHRVVHLGTTSVTVACNFTDREHQIACGSFVPVTMRRPIDTLFHEVKALVGTAGNARPTLTRIGDCLAPGTIAAAVYAGHRYARELGESASDAVPFKRELPALAPY
jgi:dimethylamine/trimethylamine dehydrogenase